MLASTSHINKPGAEALFVLLLPSVSSFACCFPSLPLQTQDLLRMERILLDSLSWRVKTPTAYTFLHLFTQSTAAMRAAGGVLACSSVAPAAPAPGTPGPKDGPLAGEVVAKAAYLTELALLDYGMLDFRPSKVAASALLLAQSWSQQGAAVAEMQAISGGSGAPLPVLSVLFITAVLLCPAAALARVD